MVNDPQFAAYALAGILTPVIIIAIAVAAGVFGAGFFLGWLY